VTFDLNDLNAPPASKDITSEEAPENSLMGRWNNMSEAAIAPALSTVGIAPEMSQKMATGFIKSAASGAGGLVDLYHWLASDVAPKMMLDPEKAKDPRFQNIMGHVKSAADWLRAGTETHGFLEGAGALGEQALEFLGTDGLLKLAGPVAKGGQTIEAAEHLANAQKLATTLKANPKIAGLVTIGAKALQEGAIMGGQTYLHTEDPRQAAIAGTLGAGLTAAAPPLLGTAGKTARAILDKFAPETIDIAKQKAIPVAKGQVSKTGEILATGAAKKPLTSAIQQEAFNAHLQNTSRVAAANSLGQLIEASGPAERLALPAPEGAEEHMFTLASPPSFPEGTVPTELGPEYFKPGEGPTPTWAQKGTGSTAAQARQAVEGRGWQTADPQEAVQWRKAYEDTIADPSFKEMSPSRQQEILRDYGQLRDELGLYYSKPHGGMKPIDLPNILGKIESPGDAAAQIRAVNGEGWEELRRLSDGESANLEEKIKDAQRTIWNRDASAETKEAARAARDEAQSALERLLDHHAGDTPLTRDYYKAMKRTYGDSMFLSNLNDEIESMANGITRENTKGGKLVRVITGNTKGLETFLAQGKNRANLTRLMGEGAEENLKQFTQLLSNPGTTRQTGAVLENVLKEIATESGITSGLLWGPAYLIGHVATGAALGPTIVSTTWGTRQLLRKAAVNPSVGRLIEYAVNNNVDARIYAPLIARAILTPLQTQKQPARGQSNASETEGPRISPTDYDMAGYTAKYGKPDQSKGQHLTDEFKLPNHMTFSTDSKYSNDQHKGGEWKEEAGKWHFYASPFNLQMHSAQDLTDYFKRVEPDAVLHLSQ
jgi:hypothetical protein